VTQGTSDTAATCRVRGQKRDHGGALKLRIFNQISDGTTTMKYELHPACSAWPEMKPEELRDLADDIAANGLRDPITLTPDGLLLDGRNRALACELAGHLPLATIFDGDPWLFSLSRNKHRRHLTTDQIALIAARLAKRTVGNPNFAIASNEAIGNAEAAKAAGVPETAIESAKVVLRHGTPEERKAVESGKAKLRKTADRVRARKRASAEPDPSSQRPATPLAKKAPVHSRDPIDDVAGELIAKCDGASAEIARLRAENTDLRTKLADADAEIEELRATVARGDAEIERLKGALHEKAVDTIGANGELKSTADDVVIVALG